MLKTTALFVTLLVAFSTSLHADLVIRGVVDGTLDLDGNGGDPKALVFEAVSAIADLSVYGVATGSNGGGTSGQEFTFPANSASVGDLVVVTAHVDHASYLQSKFPDITFAFVNSVASVNGNDAFELYWNGSVIDTYGDVNVNGTGEVWEYTDTFAVRTGGTAGAFDINNYLVQELGSLNSLDEAETAIALQRLFGQAVPEPSPILLMGLVACLGMVRRRQTLVQEIINNEKS